MALKYHVVRKKDVRKGASDDAKLYYGQIRVNYRISYQELCREVADFTLGTEADVKWIMDSLLVLMRRYLEQGNIVELEALGNFRMSAGAPGVEKEEDFHTSSFRKGRVLFAPNHKLMRDVIENVSYEKYKLIKREKDCERHHAVKGSN